LFGGRNSIDIKYLLAATLATNVSLLDLATGIALIYI